MDEELNLIGQNLKIETGELVSEYGDLTNNLPMTISFRMKVDEFKKVGYVLEKFVCNERDLDYRDFWILINRYDPKSSEFNGRTILDLLSPENSITKIPLKKSLDFEIMGCLVEYSISLTRIGKSYFTLEINLYSPELTNDQEKNILEIQKEKGFTTFFTMAISEKE